QSDVTPATSASIHATGGRTTALEASVPWLIPWGRVGRPAPDGRPPPSTFGGGGGLDEAKCFFLAAYTLSISRGRSGQRLPLRRAPRQKRRRRRWRSLVDFASFRARSGSGTYAGAPSNAILADDVIHWPSGDCGEDPGTLSVP